MRVASVVLVLTAAGVLVVISDVVAELRRGLRCGADPRPPVMRSAGRGGAYPGTGADAGGWQQREGGAAGRYGRPGAGWEALDAAGWEFLVERAAGNDGNYRPA